MGALSRLSRPALHVFHKDEEGSATIESVLWMPVFVAIFALIVDASLIFNAQASITRLVQDANRQYSVGRLASDSETEAYILAQLGLPATDPDEGVDTTVDSNGVITTHVQVDAGRYMAVGLFNSLVHLKLRVTSKHFMEL